MELTQVCCFADEDLTETSPPGKMAKTNLPSRSTNPFAELWQTHNRNRSPEKKKRDHDQHDLPNLMTTSTLVQKYRAKSSPPPPNVISDEPIERGLPRSNGSAHPERWHDEPAQRFLHNDYNYGTEGETFYEEDPEELVAVEPVVLVEKNQQSTGLFGRPLTRPESIPKMDKATGSKEPKEVIHVEKERVKAVQKPKMDVPKKIANTQKKEEIIVEESQESAEMKSREEYVSPKKPKQKFTLDAPEYISDEVDLNEILEKKPKPTSLKRLKRNSLGGSEDVVEEVPAPRNSKKMSPIQQAINRIKEGKRKEVVVEDYEEILDDEDDDVEEVPAVEVEPKPQKSKAVSKVSKFSPKQHPTPKPKAAQEPLKTLYTSRPSSSVNNTNVNNTNGEKDEEYIDDRLLYDQQENVPAAKR